MTSKNNFVCFLCLNLSIAHLGNTRAHKTSTQDTQGVRLLGRLAVVVLLALSLSVEQGHQTLGLGGHAQLSKLGMLGLVALGFALVQTGSK